MVSLMVRLFSVMTRSQVIRLRTPMVFILRLLLTPRWTLLLSRFSLRLFRRWRVVRILLLVLLIFESWMRRWCRMFVVLLR